MKTLFGIFIAFLFPISLIKADVSVSGQTIFPGNTSTIAVSAISYDGNSRTWERTVYETAPDGRIVPKKHHYIELATGLHYLKEGQWKESKEQINILPDGTAAATQGQHQVFFPGDIYNGVITLVTPDGLTLQSRPAGLTYDDGSNTVLIVELTNATGYVVGSNQVIYPNAFAGLAADLRYTYTKSGFEQDIIFRESPLTPESYGLNPDKAKLQVLTEFFNPPQPSIVEVSLPEQSGISLTDEVLSFGSMDIVPGKAFLTGNDVDESRIAVGKTWLTLNGRQFLVEEVPVNALADRLATLPAPNISANLKKTPMTVASSKLKLPMPHFAELKTNSQPIKVAKTWQTTKGVVMDYQTEIGTVTNFTFYGNQTYYISGIFTMKGTNTIEGGTVIKYATNGQVSAGSSSTSNCQTASYRPAIFTAKDDDSVGEVISGSTGVPAGYYGTYLKLNGTATVGSLSNLRFTYADTGINVASGGVLPDLSDDQFISCRYAINQTDLSGAAHINNVLFAYIKTNFVNNFPRSLLLQNVSIINVSKFTDSDGGVTPIPDVHFTNCIFANVSALTNFFCVIKFLGANNGFYNSPLFGGNRVTSASYNFKQLAAVHII